jgi:hypothetical protein
VLRVLQQRSQTLAICEEEEEEEEGSRVRQRRKNSAVLDLLLSDANK